MTGNREAGATIDAITAGAQLADDHGRNQFSVEFNIVAFCQRHLGNERLKTGAFDHHGHGAVGEVTQCQRREALELTGIGMVAVEGDFCIGHIGGYGERGRIIDEAVHRTRQRLIAVSIKSDDTPEVGSLLKQITKT